MKLFLPFLLICTFGCSDALAVAEKPEPVSDTLTDDAKEDRSAWKVRTTAFTLWMDSELQSRHQGTQSVWVARGRTSKNVSKVTALIANRKVDAKIVSPRVFELPLVDVDLIDAATGEPVEMHIETDDGRKFAAFARFSPRWRSFEGTPAGFILPGLNTIVVGGEIVFRGRAAIRDGYLLADIQTDDDQTPSISWEPELYTFDWQADQFPLIADRDSTVKFIIEDAESRPLYKTGSIRMVITNLGVTDGSLDEIVSPPTCQEETAQCLEKLDTVDTEKCGYASHVLPCFGTTVVPEGAIVKTFVADLTSTVLEYYDRYDLRDARTVKAATDAIKTSRVRRVNDWEPGHWRHDPRSTVLLYHPDVLRPNSSTIWYGAYTPQGKLLEIYPVNFTE